MSDNMRWLTALGEMHECDRTFWADCLREAINEVDRLSAQLRAAGEQLEAARDQHGYLVSAAAFDEVCEERDALANKLTVSPAVRELAENIRRNLRHMRTTADESVTLDYIDHIDTIAQQIAFDAGDAVAAPVPPSQEARDALIRACDALEHFAATVAPGASWWDDVWPEHEAAILAVKEKK